MRLIVYVVVFFVLAVVLFFATRLLLDLGVRVRMLSHDRALRLIHDGWAIAVAIVLAILILIGHRLFQSLGS
jgi:uncharacterized membrane protein YjfL (UPF0719 family)